MKKILLMAALLAGLAGNGFAMGGEEQVFCQISESESSSDYSYSERDPEYPCSDDFGDEDTFSSSDGKICDENGQNYMQILLDGIKHIDKCNGKWTEDQKKAAIDNLNKFERNEARGSGLKIAKRKNIKLRGTFPRTYYCILDCQQRLEIDLEENNGDIQYKYVESELSGVDPSSFAAHFDSYRTPEIPKLKNMDQETVLRRQLVNYVCKYNEEIRRLKTHDLYGYCRPWAPRADYADRVRKALERGVLKKQPLADKNQEFPDGWLARFAKVPELDDLSYVFDTSSEDELSE